MTRLRLTITTVIEYDAKPEHYVMGDEPDCFVPTAECMAEREEKWASEQPADYVELDEARTTATCEVVTP